MSRSWTEICTMFALALSISDLKRLLMPSAILLIPQLRQLNALCRIDTRKPSQPEAERRGVQDSKTRLYSLKRKTTGLRSGTHKNSSSPCPSRVW